MATINPSNQTITQYNLQTGGASNLLNNVAPSATSGVPVISQGAASQPVFGTVAIAGGGTNATSMATSTGIVKFDGTSLVTSSAATIDSSNRYLNTAQPAFLAYLGSSDLNKTGNGSAFTLGSATALTEVFDQGSDFNTNGTFTAPVTGRYVLNFRCLVQGCTIASSILLNIVTGNRTYSNNYNRAAAATDLDLSTSTLADMDAGDTCTFVVVTGGEAGATDDIFGGAGSTIWTGVSGYLAT